jgi:hypothetical protein
VVIDVKPEDIAGSVAWCAVSKVTFITGQQHDIAECYYDTPDEARVLLTAKLVRGNRSYESMDIMDVVLDGSPTREELLARVRAADALAEAAGVYRVEARLLLSEDPALALGKSLDQLLAAYRALRGT